MMRSLFLFFILLSTLSYAQEIDLLKKPIFSNSTELEVRFKKGIGHQLKILPEDKGTKYKAISIIKPSKGWDLSTTKEIEATFKNTGNSPVEIMFWVVGTKGWNAVGKTIQLKPGERKTSVCNLRATFPDGTHKLDPEKLLERKFLE